MKCLDLLAPEGFQTAATSLVGDAETDATELILLKMTATKRPNGLPDARSVVVKFNTLDVAWHPTTVATLQAKVGA